MPARNLVQPAFLPMTGEEMDRLGWEECDILLVSGDAYIDHPAFGAALLGRWLTAHGFRVGIVAQPRWDSLEDVTRLGRPRLFAGVSAGALDSMLAHYTAFRRIRRDDAYTPGGMAGARPNRACIVYSNLLRRAFPGLPVVLGGIEASLRRISHYDFWTDSVRRSILLDAKADLILYGMAERAILALAQAMTQSSGTLGTPAGMDRSALAEIAGHIHGAVFTCGHEALPEIASCIFLPSHDELTASPALLVQATHLMERHAHQGEAWAVQPCGEKRVVALTPPPAPLSTSEMDKLYGLPFARKPHPSYREPIPAMEMIALSITTHRGCGGGCSFCSLALHQGRRISSRSKASILAEAERFSLLDNWKGCISDVGGPSANMWQAECAAPDEKCTRDSCLTPTMCRNFHVDQQAMITLLKELQALSKVRRVRVASGVRLDLLLKDREAARELIQNYVGGQLKLAPEHSSDAVLRLMRKPGFKAFEVFLDFFQEVSASTGKKQYIVPYLMSAFPGCTLKDMKNLAAWLRSKGWRPRQVQCFVPTPGTMATALYHAGVTRKGEKIFLAKTDAQRLEQHRVLMPEAGRMPSRKQRTPRKG